MLYLCIGLFMPGLAFADCQGDFEKASSAFKKALEAVDAHQSIDEGAFEKDYTASVKSMVADKCQIQLMQLYQMAEDEKVKRHMESSIQPEPAPKPQPAPAAVKKPVSRAKPGVKASSSPKKSGKK